MAVGYFSVGMTINYVKYIRFSDASKLLRHLFGEIGWLIKITKRFSSRIKQLG